MSVVVLRHRAGAAVVQAPFAAPPGFVIAAMPPDRIAFVLEPKTATSTMAMSTTVEREVAIRSVARAPAIGRVLGCDDDMRACAVEGALGVSLFALLNEHTAGDALDPLVVAHIGQAVAAAVDAIHATCGVRAGRILDERVWLSWDGDVFLTGPFDLALDAGRYASDPLDDPSEDDRALALLLRGAFTGVDSYTSMSSAPDELADLEGNKLARAPAALRPLTFVHEPRTAAHVREVCAEVCAGGRELLAGTLAALFPDESARARVFREELAIEALPSVAPSSSGPRLADLLATAVRLDDGTGPRLLVTDLVPRSALGGSGAAPAVDVDAGAVTRFIAGVKRSPPWRLPTNDEWERIARGGGVGRPSRSCGARGLGRLWELTSTPHGTGFVTRGGPAPGRLADVDNVSYATGPSPDVGFRLVAYLDESDVPPEAEWEPRT